MSPKKNILLRNIHGYGPKEKITYVVQGIGAGIVTLIMLFPLYWMLVTSFKTGEVLLGHGIDVLPSFPISFENYVEAWTRVPLGRYIYNTVMTTAIAMTFKVVTGVLAAYGFSRESFPGCNAMFYLILGAMMVPHQIIFIPIYLLCSKLGWINTYAGIVLPGLVAPHMIFMLRQSFKSVDQSYIDAGKLDGLGTLGVIRHVMVPMCKASLFTVGLNTFISDWNLYFWPKIITKTDAVRTIGIGLVRLRDSFTGEDVWAHTNVTMAGAMITMIPGVIMFCIFQKYMLTGYAKTAMK